MDSETLSVLIPAATGLLGALLGFVGAQRTTQRLVAQSREQRRFERAQEMRAEVIPKLFVLLGNIEGGVGLYLDQARRLTEEVRALRVRQREALLGVEEQLPEIDKQAGKQERDELKARLLKELEDAKLETLERLKKLRQRVDRDFEDIKKQWDELDKYIELHAIWLPKELYRAFAELLHQYREHHENEQRAFHEWLHEWKGLEKISDESPEVFDQELELYEAKVRETREWFRGERHEREEAMWFIARKVLAVEDG